MLVFVELTGWLAANMNCTRNNQQALHVDGEAIVLVFQKVCGVTTRTGKHFTEVNKKGVIEATLMRGFKIVYPQSKQIHLLLNC